VSCFPVGSIRVANSLSGDELVFPFVNGRTRVRISARISWRSYHSVEIEFSRKGKILSVEVDGRQVYGQEVPPVAVRGGNMDDLPEWLRKLVGERGVRIV
jgi:hypothetical protein